VTGLLWLEDLLVVSVTTQPAPGATPARRVVPLQTVVVEWPAPLQPQVLALRARQLRQLAPSLPPGPQELALAYAEALRSFLDQRGRARTQPSLRGRASYQAGAMIRDAVARLNALDAQRQEMRATLNRTSLTPPSGAAPRGPASPP
jgi:hypothetical protein